MNLLLIDNSNIFITLKKKYNEDLSVRFDYDRFQKLFIKKNTAELHKVIVGSTPPKNDSFWGVMKGKGYEVHTYERTKSGEKGVDGKVIALGSRFIHEYGFKNVTLYLMSGDLDMLPLIEEAIEFKVEVILWTWSDSLNRRYLENPINSQITINYLDDIEDDVIFFEYRDYEISGQKVCETLVQRKEKKRIEEQEKIKFEQQCAIEQERKKLDEMQRKLDDEKKQREIQYNRKRREHEFNREKTDYEYQQHTNQSQEKKFGNGEQQTTSNPEIEEDSWEKLVNSMNGKLGWKDVVTTVGMGALFTTILHKILK